MWSLDRQNAAFCPGFDILASQILTIHFIDEVKEMQMGE